ncbi:hypothetical protein A7J67_03965 [Achromobacter xylosoxidans]|nr:hypothetical protein A7J67_03965 [Achromobacter xylosoxidans]
MLSSGAMTSRMNRLERKGLIERVPSPNDRRITLVRLAPAGLALIDKLLPLHVANEQQAMAALTQKEQAQLDGLLAKLLVGLGRKPGDGAGSGSGAVVASHTDAGIPRAVRVSDVVLTRRTAVRLKKPPVGGLSALHSVAAGRR